MLYDTDIDYYFRLNFSGFTGIVDALGGITVDNDVAFTKGNYTYPVGKVQMDGKMALTFAASAIRLWMAIFSAVKTS